MNANPILLQMKFARVIALFADQAKLSYNQALDFFYHSELDRARRSGVILEL